MMRQHSKVVHASSGDDNQRAAKVQERMASSISVDWGVKRAPQNSTVLSPAKKPLKPCRENLFRNLRAGNRLKI